MTTLTVNINNDKDLPLLKEILNRFGLDYKVEKDNASTKQSELFYKKLKKSFAEVKQWEKNNISLQDARSALLEIEDELKNEI